MTFTELNSDVTFFTRANTTNYPIADRTRSMNSWYNKIETMILNSQDDWDFDDSNLTTYPILTTSIVANQQDYILPSTTLKIKRVEITYDGTNWYKAEPFDVNESGAPTDSTTVRSNFSVSNPKYDVIGRSIFLYPIPTSNSASGLKIWVARTVDPFVTSDTTKEPGFDAPFHRMISIGASLDYAIANSLQNKNDLASILQDYESRIVNYYGRKQNDRQAVLKSAYVSYE